MNRNDSPTMSGWAIILAAVAMLALSGCGRKSGLDLPPNAPPQQQLAAPVDSETERANTPGVFNSGYGSNAPPAAPRGEKKPFVLDRLLN